MIRWVIRGFRSIYFALIFTALALSLMVFFLGPLAGWGDWYPLEGLVARLVTICLIWLFFLLLILLVIILRYRRNRRMTEEMVETVETVEDDVVSEEIGELRTKFKTAISELKKSKNGRKHLNELP